MTVREIQAFLAEMYGVEVSPDLISTVTVEQGCLSGLGDSARWQARPFGPVDRAERRREVLDAGLHRKIIKTRGHFPNDEAATKLLWLALRHLTRGWTMPIRPWREAMSQFAVLYPERFDVRRT